MMCGRISKNRLLVRSIVCVTAVLHFSIPLKNKDVVSIPSSRVKRLCTMEELIHGKWVRGRIHDKPPYIPAKGEVQQKTCLNFSPTSQWQDWDWVPDNNCEFINTDTAFDKELYCSLTHNKTILIMGDSISFDHFLSLTHLMDQPQALPGARKKDAMIVSKLCNGTSTLVGKRDFFLTNVRAVFEQVEPDIVILNRGAHFEKTELLMNFMNTSLLTWIDEWITTCKNDCHFLWRTTIPGHPHCGNFTEPSNSVEEMEKLIMEHSSYNWAQFQDQNIMVKGLLQQSSLKYDVMDAYYSHILRPDWHAPPNDCLHTCLPKENTLSYFFLHQLRLWKHAATLK